jgi:hypothetical protein
MAAKKSLVRLHKDLATGCILWTGDTEFDRSFCSKLKSAAKGFRPFGFDAMQLVDRAVDHEMLVRDQSGRCQPRHDYIRRNLRHSILWLLCKR